MKDGSPSLSAAVLAGGQSSRMGRDKAFVPLVPGGAPMLSLVLKVLSHVADDVFVVANDREKYRTLDVRMVLDRHSGIGAVGGIQAAIENSVYEHCLVVACDMPFLNLRLLQRMAEEPRDFDVLVPLIPGTSRQRNDGLVFQTLHAIYGKKCLPFIEQRIGEGKRHIVAFFEDVRVRTLDVATITPFDPSLHSFFNANTPESLRLAAEIMKNREHEMDF